MKKICSTILMPKHRPRPMAAAVNWKGLADFLKSTPEEVGSLRLDGKPTTCQNEALYEDSCEPGTFKCEEHACKKHRKKIDCASDIDKV